MTVRSKRLTTMLTTIAEELRPSSDRVEQGRWRAKTLISELGQMKAAQGFLVREVLAHGSHARDTAIAGFKDIDFLVVLDEDALVKEYGEIPNPADAIRNLADILRRLRGGLVAQGTVAVREQDHSVGVQYPSSKLRLDLVPALRTGEKGCFSIPDLEARKWIETRPHLLKRHVSLAERRNPHIRSVIRLVKGWRHARGKAMRIPSYAVELLLVEWARERSSFSDLTRYFFNQLAQSPAESRLVLLGRPGASPVTVRDPWSNANVTDELTIEHRTRLIENARKALDAFREADALASAGRDAAAMALLRRLFRSMPAEDAT